MNAVIMRTLLLELCAWPRPLQEQAAEEARQQYLQILSQSKQKEPPPQPKIEKL